jgi:hypothetical protein
MLNDKQAKELATMFVKNFENVCKLCEQRNFICRALGQLSNFVFIFIKLQKDF